MMYLERGWGKGRRTFAEGDLHSSASKTSRRPLDISGGLNLLFTALTASLKFSPAPSLVLFQGSLLNLGLEKLLLLEIGRWIPIV